MLTSPLMTLLYRIEEFVLQVLTQLGVPSNLIYDVLSILEGLLSSLALALVVPVPVIVFLLLLKLIRRFTNALYS